MFFNIVTYYLIFCITSTNGCTRCMINTLVSVNNIKHYNNIPIPIVVNNKLSTNLLQYGNSQLDYYTEANLSNEVYYKRNCIAKHKYTLESNKIDDSSLNNTIKEFMLNSILWYKNSLSPILPPRCRFLPTCSSYGLESIQSYGPWKGRF